VTIKHTHVVKEYHSLTPAQMQQLVSFYKATKDVRWLEQLLGEPEFLGNKLRLRLTPVGLTRVPDTVAELLVSKQYVDVVHT
jgi:hypothetical protein